MDTLDKLTILADAAKFDAACTSSGVDRDPQAGKVGMASAAGCCHSFTPDGRCITLLKVLLSNACCYDCAYCVNRSSAQTKRATFTPQELAELTVDFYKRNYIEGLFLSSGVIGSPDHTTELMIECLSYLRNELLFNGYVHAKVIPGTDPDLIDAIGRLADRLSVNLELPSSTSLTKLCPHKNAETVTKPMSFIHRLRVSEERQLLEAKNASKGIVKSAGKSKGIVIPSQKKIIKDGLALRSNCLKNTFMCSSRVSSGKRSFSPAGQSTQIIIGASPESDNQILHLSQALYQQFELKRVFFSAYIPVIEDNRLPELDTPVPLRREHRLYQADWLMRYYAFSPDELVSPEAPWLDLEIDPKLGWALAHLNQFPVEIMDAPLEILLRVPGIGPTGARRIIAARKRSRLTFDDLKRLGIQLKRSHHFLTCCVVRDASAPLDQELIKQRVIADAKASSYNKTRRRIESSQLRLF